MSHSLRQKAFALILSTWWIFDTSGVVVAMQVMDDQEMSSESGAGLAFPFENFRFEMEKTSFIQLTGSDTNLCTAGSTTSPVGCTTFRRGDLRYYGLTMSRGTTGGTSGTITTTNVTDWFGNGCTAGTFGLGCPISSESIINYSNHDNPFIFRVFNYTGFDTAGTSTNSRPVLEILGPSNMDPFRWSFFGEVETGRTYGATASNGLYPITGATCSAGSGAACLLQVQNIILGKPASRLKPPSVGGSVDASNPYYGPAIRLFQYAGTTAATGSDPATYGIQYESRLSGDYRMSVNNAAATPSRGVAPDFNDEEGMYFRNVQAYLPLGQLHYQALVFDDTQPGSTGVVTTNGNVSIEVTRIPNVTAVYQDFYSFADGTSGSTNSGYTRTGRADRYYLTHGYSEWGTQFPTNANSNGLGGSGVNSTTYSGTGDPDGATRIINSTNFPAATCASNGGPNFVDGSNGNNCTTWSGQTVGELLTAPTTTRDQVISAGGIVFVSRNSSSTWNVLPNQNQAASTINMLWVNNSSSNGGGSNWANTYRLERDSRYTAGNVANVTRTVNAINLGTARIDGLLINHMKIETLGGQ
ncbi:MAG: hypothetical protein K0R03_103 [Moraxellaceae bacterium]|jgi:hypothetical protein|nr:hypothetical protein [Moraxellaceae bacterium]